MQTFQGVGLKCDSSITILKQKNNTNRINYRGEKNRNQAKLFFFPHKKAKEIYIWVLLIYPGKGPCQLTGLQAVFPIFCTRLV